MSRRRNFIPGLNKKQSYFVTVGGVGILGALLFLALRNRQPKLKEIYDWDEELNAMAGHPFTVRMPRGSYQVISPDVLLQASADYGNDTHVVLVPRPQPGQLYTIDTLLVDQLTNKTFPIHIEAHPLSAFQRNRRPTIYERLHARRYWEAEKPRRRRAAAQVTGFQR